MNNCKRCNTEMRRSPIYHMVDDELVAEPGYECHKCGMAYLTNSDEWVDMRADPDDDSGNAKTEPDEPPPDLHGGHVGFYADNGAGGTMHVLGDPNMSDETLKALQAIAQAAMRAIDRGEIK